ncbi:MAG TPA: aminoglycoside phosphotransferase [Streptosporangiaceae bacterium]
MNLLEHALATWMPAQRWFPGDRIGGDVTVIADTLLAAGDPELRHLIVSVRSGRPAGPPAGPPPARYQVLAGFRRQMPAELAHAVIGTDQRGKTVYDGLHDSELTTVLLRAIAGERADGPLVFTREPDVAIDLTARSLVLSVEQSNTSLVFGDSAILKVFRRLFAGPNPDLEITSALARLGSSDIARPLGSVSSRLDGEPVLLAVLSEFQRGACDGWQLALTSLRDLYARATDRAAEAGGDFAGEAHRLGAATARVHADLARAFGTQTLNPEELAGLAGQMTLKLKEASAEVPALATFADKIATAYAALAEITEPVTVQRIHGDYHLGQVLRSRSGWVLLDFEGEPLVPLDRRRDLAPALRDVAGLLRSFDYAARHLLVGHPDASRLSGTALEWVARNSAAFCEGYAEEHGSDPRDQAILLRALMLDKAVYEVMYEARHRPSWQDIPLDAIAGL